MFRRVVILGSPLLVSSSCPFGGEGTVPANHPAVDEPWHGRPSRQRQQEFAAALAKLDIEAVQKDIVALLTNSQDEWPADNGHYGPFFVRLGWHCAGSYRLSDGRGGCDGGRQRFEPERSWADNTNLDKARNLLWPIKQKYGAGLSWGDLIILTATTAIKDMGGPVLGFCAGRIDDVDGSASWELGPSWLQEKTAPCAVNGTCTSPLGTSTVGLIYVNPEGPMGNPDPVASAPQVRDTFGRMGMNDSETVALIGAHAFGKTHGACPKGAGPSPLEDPANPWPGLCGTGKGFDTFTSGFNGLWTSSPTSWGNEFFRFLQYFTWEVHIGPGGHNQWRIQGAEPSLQPFMRLTTDISLTKDPKGEYQKIVKEFAEDQSKLDNAFAHAWYKLVTRDMGPVTRCVGNQVPLAQEWQHPLPAPPAPLASFEAVKGDIRSMIKTSNPVLPADKFNGEPYYGGLLVRLAYRCAATFRTTDYKGGCNGARIRVSPEKDWPANRALDKALSLLDPIKAKYGDSLTWADLIVLAGTTALEEAGSQPLKFCGGRSDAMDGTGSVNLEPKVSGDTDTALLFNEGMKLLGLSRREQVVLIGGGHSLGKMHTDRSGFEGAWTPEPTKLSNQFFTTLLSQHWEEYTTTAGKVEYKATGKDLYMLKSDMLLKTTAELLTIAQEYASDNVLFLNDFANAWTKLVNADRFDGPTGNVCDCSAAELVV